MEKTIILDGNEVVLKASAFNTIVYRNTFGEDIFKATSSLLKASDGKNILFDKIEMEAIMKLVWTMAKTADEKFPDYEKWVKGLESFPLFDVLNEVHSLIIANLTSTTPIKNVKPVES